MKYKKEARHSFLVVHMLYIFVSKSICTILYVDYEMKHIATSEILQETMNLNSAQVQVAENCV